MGPNRGIQEADSLAPAAGGLAAAGQGAGPPAGGRGARVAPPPPQAWRAMRRQTLPWWLRHQRARLQRSSAPRRRSGAGARLQAPPQLLQRWDGCWLPRMASRAEGQSCRMGFRGV